MFHLDKPLESFFFTKSRIISLFGISLFLSSCATMTTTPPAFPPESEVSYVSLPAQNFTPFEFPPARQTTFHEVAPMESLWRIGKMYDVSQESIKEANYLQSDQLEIGQELIIPNASPLRPLVSLYPNKRWKFIVVHHTASQIGNAKLVNEWHQNRGFQHGLGYHFLIDNGTLGKLDGQIESSPRWIKQEQGAHCKAGNMNKKGIGISLVGNFSESWPSEPQIDSLVFLIKELMNYYNIPHYRVIRHLDAPGATTECPGIDFPWWELKQQIRN